MNSENRKIESPFGPSNIRTNERNYKKDQNLTIKNSLPKSQKENVNPVTQFHRRNNSAATVFKLKLIQIDNSDTNSDIDEKRVFRPL